MDELFFIPLFGLIFFLPFAFYLLTVYCWYRIMQKAGYGNLGLIALLPPLSIVLILILTFGQWSMVEKRQTTIVVPSASV